MENKLDFHSFNFPSRKFGVETVNNVNEAKILEKLPSDMFRIVKGAYCNSLNKRPGVYLKIALGGGRLSKGAFIENLSRNMGRFT